MTIRFRLFTFAALNAFITSCLWAQNWEPLTNGLPLNASVQAIAGNSDGSDLFIGVGLPLDGVGIYRSTDNGLTWTKTADGPGPNTGIYANELLVHGSTIIATRLVNTGELFYSHDSGASWHLATGIPNNSAQPVGANGGVVDLARDGSTYYCQVMPQGPYKSTDGGQTWSPANTGIAGTGSHIEVINGRVFASQLFSGLWSSDNQGSTWTARTPTPALTYTAPARLTTLGDRIVIAGQNSTPWVLSAVAGEGAWVGSDAGLPTGSRHNDLEASATTIFSAGGTTTTGGAMIPYVAQSSDAGLTWAPLSASGLVGPETTWHYASGICVHNGYLYAATYSTGGTPRLVRLALTNGVYPQPPTIITQPTPTANTVNAGGSATFQVVSSGSGTLTYQWRKNGETLGGKTSPTLTLTNVQANDTGSYTVVITQGAYTVTSNPAVLTIAPSDPGKLDYSFNAPISKVYSGAFSWGGTGHKVWPLPDGKILVAGDFDRAGVTPNTPYAPLSTGGTPCTNIARFTANGSLDPDFTLQNATMGGVIKAIAVQPDGKILIGGTFTSYAGTARNRLARLLPNGALDPDFMATGSGFDAEVLEVLLQPDGKILVGGSFNTVHGQSRNFLARLLPNGDRDPDFLPSLSGPNLPVRAIALSGDSLYIGGDFGSFNSTSTGRVAKTTLTGTLDSSFNPGGSGISSGAVYDLAVQPDGKLLVTGSFTSYNGSGNVANRILRLTSTGAIDHLFGAGLNQLGATLAVQPDGKIIVGGNFTSAGGTTRNRLARFLADGTLDADFNPGAGLVSQAENIVLQTDGKLLVAGGFTSYDGITRYLVARVFTGVAAPVTTTPFTSYLAAANIAANQRGPLDDPDSDGLSNLLEFALGLTPGIANPDGAPDFVATGNLLTLTYTRAQASGVTYEVETSTDLLTWTTAGVTQGTPDASNVVTATIALDVPGRFLRLKVSVTPVP